MSKIDNKLGEQIRSNSWLRRLLATPSPWWMILLADLIAVAISCWATFKFNYQFTTPEFGFFGSTLGQFLTVMAVYFIFMVIARPFRYVIRLSVVEDMYRVTVTVVGASVFLALGTAVCSAFTGYPFLQMWNIFVIGLISYMIMMLSRLAIKYLYVRVSAHLNKRKRVVVLGTSERAVALTRALLNEADGMYRPVAVISLSSNDNNAAFNDLAVYKYSRETIDDIFSHHSCDTIVFSSANLDFMRSGVADVFLEHNIKLMMYSEMKEFNGENERSGSLSAAVRGINIEDLLGRDVIKPDTTEVKNQLQNQVVMVTGAAGSIGSEIVRQVAAMHAAELVLVDQAETPMHELQLLMEEKFPQMRIHLFIGDVSNKARMEQAFAHYHPRYVFHAAAYKHVPMMERNPAEAILTNVFGTKVLADLSVEYGVEKFVMISTDKAVNPTNVMGASKRIAEIYVQSLFFDLRRRYDRPATQFITTRFGNVLGSNGSVIPLFRRQIEQGGPVTVTHRDIIRYFMTIPEACSLVLQAGTMGQGGEIFIFDMGQPVKIYDLATRMISLSGLRPGVDIEIVETGLRPGEKLYEELLNDKEKTTSTRNNKIMIAKVRTYDLEAVLEHLRQLRELTTLGQYHDIVAEMKRMVPEYKSQNSVWASIDKEIKAEDVITEIPSKQ